METRNAPELVGTDCEHCDYEWAVRVDGEITTAPAGRLRDVNDHNVYCDKAFPTSCGNMVGFFQELSGGRLARIINCVEVLHPGVTEFEVLVEGRWIKFKV
jgi:hypothetical protein